MKARKLKAKSKKYFDQIAEENYVIPEPAMCYEALLERLKKYEDFHSLADISCGRGDMLKKLIDVYGTQKQYYGVDLSPKTVKMARVNTQDQATILEGDVDDLPLKNKSMDILLNMHSFHHYPNPVHALKEMRRVLTKNGLLFLVENDYPQKTRWRINLKHILYRHSQGDVRMYSEKSLRKMLRTAKFDVLSREPIAEHSQILICRKK